jgi:transposase
MLSLPSSTRIRVCTQPTDMRKGIDSLCAIVESSFPEDIYSGTLFVFVSRRRDRLKILTWDAGGFVIYYKRLEAGCFKLPIHDHRDDSVTIDAAQLTMMLRGIDLSRVRKPILWEPATS